MLTPIKIYTSDNIDELNKLLWADISIHGNKLHFGSIDEPKDATEIFSIVQLHGKALIDLYNGKLPKGWQFGEESQKVYIEMLKNPEKGEQPYTYGERLHKYNSSERISSFEDDGTVSLFYKKIEINQIENSFVFLRKYIGSELQSNRICGVLWSPRDLFLKDPPCFNWFQLRLSEKNKVSLRVLFRSHDYGNASFANWGAIIRCFVDEVIKPAGGELEELICISASAHVYNSDENMINSLIGKVPDYIKRMVKK